MPLLVEMGFGGLVTAPETIPWVDVSRRVDVLKAGVTITRGAADELSETQPGSATMRLENQDGYLTPGNSASPYNVRRNTPVRISQGIMPTLTGSAPYPLAMLGDDFDDGTVNSTLWPTNVGGATETSEGRLRIPMTPGVDTNFTSARQWTLVGSTLTAKLCAVPAVNGSSNAAASMWVTSTTAGTRIGWRYDALTGVISAQSQVGFADGAPLNLTYDPFDHAWLRVWQVGGLVYWMTSSDGYSWTARRSIATPAWVTSQTHAADFPTTRTGGTAGYVEWDLVGATMRPRFHGLVNEFPVDWEGLVSHVKITATDLFKRLNRQPALRSMLAQEIIEQTPMVYYPLTEDSASTTAGDIGGNGAPSLAITQSGAGGTLTLGSADGPVETGEQAPVFTPSSATAGKWLSVDLGPAFEDPPMQAYLCFEAWFKTTTTGRCILGVHTPDLVDQHLLSIAPTGGLQIEWTSGNTPTMTTETVGGPTTLADGNWHHVVYDQREGEIYLDGVMVDNSLAVPRRWGERMLHVGGYRNSRLWSGSIGHVAIYSTLTISMGSIVADHYTAGMTGYAGEDADVRMQRLARYAGVDSVTILGSTHDPIASQGPAGSTVVARMREVESTESGRLYAERDYYGLAYQSRDVRYNPDPAGEVFTIAYADTETGNVELSDDDQKLTNSIEASRPGGATQRVTSPTSIADNGLYDAGALSILKTSDNSVLDAANWRVSRYADPEPELREVAIEAYTMANYLDILDADISSYFSVTSMPSQAPASTARVTVEGYTETIKEKSHVIQFHTSATNNDSVWVLGDSTYSVLDSTTRLAYAESLSALALTSAFLGSQSTTLTALPAAAAVLLAVLGTRVARRTRRALRLRMRDVPRPELDPVALSAPPLPTRVPLAERLARVARRTGRASRVADG
ncbi:LamG domain-containing protein [Streptomyces sp. NBC_00289]|uniref:LamG-like jellyroll fold domain-containing protein n=1 Tax=Streptomyces sp. NBC_00289 TaxID=2975703 RepID=UPI003254B9FA